MGHADAEDGPAHTHGGELLRSIRVRLARLLPRGVSPAQWATIVAGLAMVLALALVADLARRRADEYRQAEAAVARIEAASATLQAATWRGLYDYAAHGPSPSLTAALTARGVASWAELSAGLDDLGALGLTADQKRLAQAAADVRRSGMAALGAYRLGRAALAVRLVQSRFEPAVVRLGVAARQASRRQHERAAGALARARLAFLGAFVSGLLLFALAAWRFERLRRRARVERAVRAAERREEARLRALLDQSRECVLVLDRSLTVRWAAGPGRSLLGMAPSELVGRSLLGLVHPDDAGLLNGLIAAASARHSGEGVDCRLRHLDGYWVHVEAVARDRCSDPLIGGIVVTLRDIGERKQFEQELLHRAFHDALTGLPNRALFEDRVGQVLAQVRESGLRAAVMLIDLDDFKTVNDGLGHAIGDDVLREAGRRIARCVKPTDTVARFGGDEFALLATVGSGDDPLALALRVLAALRDPYAVDGRELNLSASIGVVDVAPDTTVAELLRDADTAMYAAKEGGKDRVELFDTDMHRRVLERLELRGDLQRALDAGEFELHYQPIVDLESRAPVGFEALLRWRHPRRGLVPPLEFVPLAEETGLIIPIGRWVLRKACATVARWREQIPGCDVDISVNVAPRQLRDEHFERDVQEVLRETGIAPSAVVLEITESLLAEDPKVLAARLERLRALGVRIAVDDFGTGYSALSHLRTLPIDVLKVDRTFIDGIDRDREKEALVRGIVSLGSTLRLEVVAEGIEDEQQADCLRGMQSQLGQGFYFARPLPEKEAEKLLRASLAAPGNESAATDRKLSGSVPPSRSAPLSARTNA